MTPFGYIFCYQGQEVCFSYEPQDDSIPKTYYWQLPIYDEGQLELMRLSVAEACAKICDEQHDKARTSPGAHRADCCATKIRNFKWKEHYVDE